MSVVRRVPEATVVSGDMAGPLSGLLTEADRQLRICNACRYCEGLCAVFPAVERRSLFEKGDISQLANLCHDCRACYDACMYTDPHEFDINIPRVLASVRLADYDRYVWPNTESRFFRGWSGVVLTAVLACVVVVALAVANAGPAGIIMTDRSPESPYALIPYGALLAVLLVPAVFSVGLLIVAGFRYWKEVGGAPRGWRSRPVWRAVWYAATLRYLQGGGGDCYYPEEDIPSSWRRRLHAALAYGFALCLVSTISAGVLQDTLGHNPPFPWLSVPVLSGLVGGVGMAVGCAGLISLKLRASRVTGTREMTMKDFGLLVALGFLACSGLATLFTRTTPAYGVIFLIHLAAVVFAFAVASYSKIVHAVFRFLALVRDNLEQVEEWGPAASQGTGPT